MSPPPWLVRAARPTKHDRALLRAFVCADAAVPWQVEVEQFIRGSLIDWAFDPHARTASSPSSTSPISAALPSFAATAQSTR